MVGHLDWGESVVPSLLKPGSSLKDFNLQLHPASPSPTGCPYIQSTYPSGLSLYQLAKLASSIITSDFLLPYQHLLSPYIERLDSLLASLQLTLAPDSPPRSLVDLLPHLICAVGFIALIPFLMRRFFGLGCAEPQQPKQPQYTGPISGNNAADPYRPEDLKDDNVTLQSLGIEHGAKILTMGSNAPPISAPKTSVTPKQEEPRRTPEPPKGPEEKIEAVRDHVNTKLVPLVNDFINGKGTEKRVDTHRKLGETIMAELLKLDGVETEDPQIRARRKELVKDIQGHLDALDQSLRESP
ncbi:BAG domain-containing protein [Trichophaea hybrida]|nr:BAG domain-containing protein [Trichophaea hybrida]